MLDFNAIWPEYVPIVTLSVTSTSGCEDLLCDAGKGLVACVSRDSDVDVDDDCWPKPLAKRAKCIYGCYLGMYPDPLPARLLPDLHKLRRIAAAFPGGS
jgi:hypothetical protein